jgi:hypothetical protein
MAYNANKTMTDNDRTIFLTVSSMLIATGTPARPPGRRHPAADPTSCREVSF